jgi:hypothetical protein
MRSGAAPVVTPLPLALHWMQATIATCISHTVLCDHSGWTLAWCSGPYSRLAGRRLLATPSALLPIEQVSPTAASGRAVPRTLTTKARVEAVLPGTLAERTFAYGSLQ